MKKFTPYIDPDIDEQRRPAQIGWKIILIDGKEMAVRMFENAVQMNERIDSNLPCPVIPPKPPLTPALRLLVSSEFGREPGLYCLACKTSCVRFGIHRDGRQKFRCSECRRTFVSGVARLSHWIGSEREAVLERAYISGMSQRTAAKEAGVSRKTSRHRWKDFRKKYGIPTCKCGKQSDHKGWCRIRYQASPKRQETVRRLHVSRWEKIAAEFDSRDSQTFDVSVLIVAAMFIGQNPRTLSTALSKPLKWVCERTARLIKNGIWRDGKWCVDWTDEEVKQGHVVLAVSFALYSLVAEGTVIRIKSDEYKIAK